MGICLQQQQQQILHTANTSYTQNLCHTKQKNRIEAHIAS